MNITNSPVDSNGFSSLHRLLSQLSAKITQVLDPAMTGYLPSLVSAGGVVERNNQLLFIERSDGYGMDIPGGLILWRETPEEAVKREIYEETGIEVEPKYLIGSFNSDDPRFGCVCLAYVCNPTGGYVRASAEGIAQWISIESLPKELAFGNEIIVETYLRERDAVLSSRLMIEDISCMKL